MIKRFTRNTLAALCLAALAAGFAHAVDQFVIEAPAAVMAGDFDAAFSVEPRQSGQVDAASHNLRVKDLPKGFRLTPGDSGGGIPVSGKTRLQLSVDRGVKPGPYAFRLEKSDDAKLFARVSLRVQAPVAKLSVTPVDLKFSGRLGDPLSVEIIALDAQGAIVTAFRGAVDLDASAGAVQGGPIEGSAFKNGVAHVAVKFTGTDPVTGLNKLRATARNFYLANGGRVQGTLDVSLRAGK